MYIEAQFSSKFKNLPPITNIPLGWASLQVSIFFSQWVYSTCEMMFQIYQQIVINIDTSYIFGSFYYPFYNGHVIKLNEECEIKHIKLIVICI